MNSADRDRLIQKLTAEIAGEGQGPGPDDPHSVLEGIKRAGASRFGVSAYRPDNGFSACDLAPPLARMIDHTALKPETTEDQIRQLCEDARKYCFASVCVNPCYVQLAATLLRGSPIAVCTVIGFPLGAARSTTKAREAETAVDDGATELDMVINVGFLKSQRFEAVEADIAAVVEVARRRSRNVQIVTKVILETALLTDVEKVIASVLSKNAGADFVKTSTGFSSGGATAADVALMRRVVGPDMGVKASGGVRSQSDAETMIAHGATRLGASASVEIMKGLTSTGSY
jgi:deoxyribose-phosphate aldolase